jgi:hypothetical protein
VSHAYFYLNNTFIDCLDRSIEHFMNCFSLLSYKFICNEDTIFDNITRGCKWTFLLLRNQKFHQNQICKDVVTLIPCLAHCSLSFLFSRCDIERREANRSTDWNVSTWFTWLGSRGGVVICYANNTQNIPLFIVALSHSTLAMAKTRIALQNYCGVAVNVKLQQPLYLQFN